MTKDRAAKKAKQADPQALVEVLPDIPLPGGNVIIQKPGQPPHIGMARSDGLKTIGGSDMMAFNQVLLSATTATMHNTVDHLAAATAALAAFKPTDEIEGMIAAQAVAMHHGAMECFRRARLPDQDPNVCSKLRKDGANLARGMIDMLDGLDRKRGKRTHQVVTVERVVVHDGGQAIVGNVQSGAARKTGEG